MSTPSAILAANRRAMTCLGEGDMEASHTLLMRTLTEAEQLVKSIPPPPSAATGSRDAGVQHTTAQQEILLAYSVTLNNLGCQLRREDQLDSALSYIQRASDVEYALFGKPACSTMLNMSSVLVGMGRSAEALPIAKSCVLAAQGGEPTLLITALHNLAVALGQQQDAKERRLALSTMLRALRESEHKLGDRHPTTVMLREKCGMTSPWLLDVNDEDELDTDNTPSKGSPSVRYATHNASTDTAAPAPRKTPSRTQPSVAEAPLRGSVALSARERGRKALGTLNFGTPHGSPLLPSYTPSLTIQESSAAAPAPMAAPLPRQGRLSPTPAAAVAAPKRAAPRDLPPLPVVPSTVYASDSCSSDTHRGSSSGLLPRTDKAEGDAVVKPLVQQRASIAMGGSLVTAASLPSLHAERRASSVPLREVAQPVPAPAIAPVTLADAPPPPKQHDPARAPAPSASLLGTLRNEHAPDSVPRYMRFAAVEEPFPNAHSVSAGVGTTELSRASLYAAPTSATTGGGGGGANWRNPARPGADLAIAQTMPTRPAGENGASQPTMEVHRSVFYNNPGARQARETLRQHRQVEEDAYRRRRHRRTAEMEAEERFQAKLRVIEARRDERAAVVIQKAWRHWWRMFGHPRFLLQKRQAEERRRRRAERLAMEARHGSHTQGHATHQTQKRAKPSAAAVMDEVERLAMARRALPQAVVRCADMWLQKTACRRYLVRHKYRPLPRYIREQDVANAIVRLQSIFRGRRVRHTTRALLTAQGALATTVDPQEVLEYAAMVIQRAYRCAVARRTVHTLYLQRYTDPTRRLQAWWRATIAEQRDRRVDTRSLRQRDQAALRIQTAWRGYVARLRFLMLRLRSTMDTSRSTEAAARCCLQRVGRACVSRRRLAASYVAAQQTRRLLCAAEKSSGTDTGAAAAEKKAAPQPRWPDLVIPRNAYEAECLERAPALNREREAEREAYDVAMYYEPNAERERLAWCEAIRLRPTEVALRRADEDLRTDLEAHTVLRDRAATKIQRLFRSWRRHYHNLCRDRGLLLRSRGLYQQRELERRFQRQQRAKDLERGVALYGHDCSAPVRALRHALQEELRELEAVQPVAVEAVRSRDERHYDEAVIQRDESIVRVTYSADLARLREDMEDRRAHTGRVYEHPYYKPYPNDEFRLTLGID